MRWAKMVEPGLYAVAGVGLIWYIFAYFIPPLLQSEPARYSVDTFAADYRGEQWLEVTGFVALDHLKTSSSHGTMKGKAHIVSVPLVPRDWKPTDPVHVCVRFDDVPIHNFEAWKQGKRNRPIRVAGRIQTLGGPPYNDLFPRLTFERPTVNVIADYDPDPLWVIGIMLVVGLLYAYFGGKCVLRLLRKDPREERKEEEQPRMTRISTDEKSVERGA
jgi:hypothetical protein